MLKKHLKLRIYKNDFVNLLALLFKIMSLESYKLKTYVKVITNVYHKMN